jgi:DNA-binding MarR family transcriptional regulator
VPQRLPAGPLTDDEEAAWRAIVRVVMLLPRVIEADLLVTARLDLAEYTVMSILSEQPARTMRNSDLAAQAALSARDLARVIDRLERQGVVEQVEADGDGRGQSARLTDFGLRRLEEAYPSHVESVRRRVIDHLGSLDLGALTAALNAIGATDR